MMLMGGNVEWDFSATSHGKVDPHTTGFQTITSDASDYVEFSFRTGKFVEKKKSLLLSQKLLCLITNKDSGYMLNTVIGAIQV